MKIFHRLSFRIDLLASLVLVILTIGLTSCGRREAERKAKEEAAAVEAAKREREANRLLLMSHINEYLLLPTKTNLDQAYIRGKIVPVYVPGKAVHVLYDDLPDDLRAKNPGEVGTVILITCHSRTVGYYEGGARATTETCELKLVDTTIPAVIGVKSLSSDPPPNVSKDQYGYEMSVTSAAIIKYLRSLPRK